MQKLIYFLLLLPFFADSQNDIRLFVFGNSLINHTFEVQPPTPSQETSVPHWFQILSEAGGHQFAVDGQFGFLPQHRNVPPIPNWGFDIVRGVWDADLIPFSAADFNTILLTPANFIQWQVPSENFPGESFSPIEATQEVFQWCADQEEDMTFYIYENWADMAPYLSNGFPPTAQEWSTYNQYVQGEFKDWFADYHEAVATQFPDNSVCLIPVGTTISRLLQTVPFNQIPIDELYQDDAPHGLSTIYFLAAMITYSAIHQEPAPRTLEIDPIVHQTVRDNYAAVVDFIWETLLNATDDSGANTALCASRIIDDINDLETETVDIQFQNPVRDVIELTTDLSFTTARIYDLHGRVCHATANVKDETMTIDCSNLPAGWYVLSLQDAEGRLLGERQFVRQ
ncbi:MAG: T9SS type A sorting domain-containing protein [Bacteroidota bacterium]